MSENKNAIRLSMQAMLKHKTAGDCLTVGSLVTERLTAFASVALADTVMAYLPIAGELNFMPLLQSWIDESRIVCSPIVDWESKTMKAGLLTGLGEGDLIPDQFGIRNPSSFTPVPHDTIEVIIVPGVAFTKSGIRLGRGGGYYDKFLSAYSPPIILGVCFDEQVVESLPTEEHDIRMTAVITPTQTLI
ncbi:MAG: 5-formyltetrahydrofolate cyclo-ligase [Phycisphaerae bacterium]|nr:5-formyltetrahydrofolate cyclo-ligase [Phycisphaerae bacterium]